MGPSGLLTPFAGGGKARTYRSQHGEAPVLQLRLPEPGLLLLALALPEAQGIEEA